VAGHPAGDRAPFVAGHERHGDDDEPGEPGEAGTAELAGLRHGEAHGDPPHRATASRSDSATTAATIPTASGSV